MTFLLRSISKWTAKVVGPIVLVCSSFGLIGLMLNSYFGWKQFATPEEMNSLYFCTTCVIVAAGICRYIEKD